MDVCICEKRVVITIGAVRTTRWFFTYRDRDGWEYIETLTKREVVTRWS